MFSIGELVGYLRLEGGPQFDAGVRSAQGSLDLTATAAKRTSGALGGTDTAMQTSARESARLRAAQLSLIAAQERYNTLLGEDEVATGRLAASQAALIRAQERVRASTPIVPATISSFDRLQGKIRGVIADTARMAAGFAVIGAVFELGDAIKSANQFQREMTLIHTQAGASADEVTRMTKAVLQLAPQVAQSPEELATSLYHIESVGLRGAKALDVLKVSAEGAKVGNSNLEQTTNALTSTVASGIPGVQDMAAAMGQLNAIVGSGDMHLSDLNDALGGGILAIVKGYGLSLRDVGAALATFGDNNIRGADAATMLRMAVQAMSVPAVEGRKRLEELGLSVDTLAEDMTTGGLNKAVLDLNAHLKASGVQADQVGQTLTTVFGKKAGPGLAVLLGQVDRLQQKYAELDRGATTFGEAWAATQKNASFGFDKLKTSAEAAGVQIAGSVGPALGQVASDVAVVLPSALGILGHALAPVAAGWRLFGGALEDSAGAAHTVAESLHAIEPIAGGVGAAVLGMWLGFKAGEVVVGVVGRVTALIQAMPAKVSAAQARVTSFWAAQSAAATTAAATTATSAAAIEAEAAAMSGTLVAEGEAARIGWAGLAGPIGAAALGVGVIISMFHRSAGASKEATEAAKAYTDALSGGGGGGEGSIVGAIVKQLSDNGVSGKIADLNAALGATKFSGKQFVDAIETGAPALSQLQNRLQSVIDTNLKFVKEQQNARQALGQPRSFGQPVGPAFDQAAMDKAATAADRAKKLLADLNAQYGALTAAAQKDLEDTKTFAGVASSIDKVTAATDVGTGTAKTYAQMLGLVADENNIVTASQDDLDRAVSTVADAYNNATQTGSAFLDQLKQFSASAGTSADRASLIGSTLVAANGDMLAYSGAVQGAIGANQSLVDAFTQQAQQLQQQQDDAAAAAAKAGQDQKNAQNTSQAATARLAAAEARLNEVRSKRTATAAQIKSAEASVASAQAAAAKAAGNLSAATDTLNTSTQLSFKDTELAAINLQTGMIDLSAKGAGPLIQQLQSVQTAAEQAASATYQHEVATKGAKDAADDAYTVYVSQTRGQLLDEAKQLGLTKDQAKKFADVYFGLADADNIKKTIEMEGSDPVVDVLNKIGELLAKLTGQTWVIGVQLDNKAVIPKDTAFENRQGGKAAGGPINGPGSGTSDTAGVFPLSNGEWVVPARAAAKYRPFLSAITRGSSPIIPAAMVSSTVTSSARAPMPAVAPASSSSTDRIVFQGDFKQTIVNPVREPASVSSPAGERRAFNALDGLA